MSTQVIPFYPEYVQCIFCENLLTHLPKIFFREKEQQQKHAEEKEMVSVYQLIFCHWDELIHTKYGHLNNL